MKKLIIVAMILMSGVANAAMTYEAAVKECRTTANVARDFAEYRDSGMSESDLKKEINKIFTTPKNNSKAHRIARVVFRNTWISPDDFHEMSYKYCMSTWK